MFKKKKTIFRHLSAWLIFALLITSLQPVEAQGTPFLPLHSNLLGLSAPYSFPVLRGIRVYPSNPFKFDFMVDSGNNTEVDRRETSLLVKYFLTFLTIPEEDLWVNLSPYEAGHIVPEELSRTDAGNALLEQDKILKQLASSLTYPESRLGKEFWAKVYKIAYERFGTTDLPINTYNKVWIVPDKAIVYDLGYSALIGQTHLKVMLEEDYLALKKHAIIKDHQGPHQLTAAITREIILPELEKEVNEGKNFAPVRQLLYSLVLADWFKRALKRSLLSNVYVDKKKISGVDGVDKNSKERIYKQYLHLYKVGAYNYIREDVDPVSQQVVPRKYFSGGCFLGDSAMWVDTLRVFDPARIKADFAQVADQSSYRIATVDLDPIGGRWPGVSDKAQTVSVSSVRKLALAVLFSLPLVSGAVARAATITSNADGKTFDVKVDSTKDTLGGILRSTGYSHLWGQNGAVAQIGEIVKDQIPDEKYHTIYLHHTYHNIPYPQGVNSQKPSSSVVPYIQPSARPAAEHQAPEAVPTIVPPAVPVASLEAPAEKPEAAPAVRPEALPAAEPAKQPVSLDKKSYPLSARVPLGTVSDEIIGPAGIVPSLAGLKKQYKENEPIVIAQDLELDGRIEQLRKDLKIYENTLAAYTALRDNHQAATDKEVLEAQQQVQSTRQALAEATIKKENQTVRSPSDIIILDTEVHEGQSVSKGTPWFRYEDLRRGVVAVNVPSGINYYNDISLSIDGKPVESVSAQNWSATIDSQIHLLLYVTSKNPLTPGKVVQASGKINYPDKDNKKLYSIARGPSTIVKVNDVEERHITALAKIPSLEVFVHEGDNVAAGQLLARGDSQTVQNEIDAVSLEIANINAKLQLIAKSADGTQFVPNHRAQADTLITQRSDLEKRLEILKVQKDSMEIRSPFNGTIDYSAQQHGVRVFDDQDIIFNINTDTVFLGSTQDMQNAVLLPGSNLKIGDPVLVQTVPQGVRLIATVTGFDKTPSSSTNQLAGLQSIVVKVYDPKHTLRPGLRVEVSEVKASDKQLLLSLLPAAAYTTQAGSSPPPSPPVDDFIFDLSKQGPYALNVNWLQPAVSIQGDTLTLSQLEQQVLANNYLTIEQVNDFLKKKKAEALPGAGKIDLLAGIYTNGTQATSLYGIKGAFGNLAGSVLGGNALTGAGLAILEQVYGQVMPILTRQIPKEKALAKERTAVADHILQNARYQQVYAAIKEYNDLGIAQNKKAQLEQDVINMEKARDEMLARESSGIGPSTFDVTEFDTKIDDVNAQILDLKAQIENFEVELNFLRGKARADFKKPISVNLQWTGIFPGVSDEQENEWLKILTGDNSPNPQMQEAFAEGRVVAKEMQLKKIDRLPQLNVGGVNSSDALKNSEVDVGPLQRTPVLVAGPNTAAVLDVPLFDKKTKIELQILALEKSKSDQRTEETRRELTKELEESVAQIRSLSAQIVLADKEYAKAFEALQKKADRVPDLYLTEDVVNTDLYRTTVELAAKADKLKSQYRNEEARLRALRVLKPEESLVKNPAMLGDQAQLAFASFFKKFALGLALAIMPLAALAQQPAARQQPRGDFGNQTQMDLNYGAPSGDPVPTRRIGALELLEKSKDTKSLLQILLKSPKDVQKEFMRFMVEKKPHDLTFFVHVINEAEGDKNQFLADLGYQSLDDIFSNYPEVFKQLSLTNFGPGVYPDVSPEIANKVFLTYIKRAPKQSSGRRRLLYGTAFEEKQDDGTTKLKIYYYWTTNGFANAYNSLMAAGDTDLAGEIKDAIMKRQGDENINQLFGLDGFGNLGPINLVRDVKTATEIQEMAKLNRLALIIAPEGMEKYAYAPLYKRALKETDRLISKKRNQADGASPLYNDSTSTIDPGGPLYFTEIGEDQKIEYLKGLKDISELARLLPLKTKFQDQIFDKLMADHQGRVKLSEIYLNLHDKDLKKKIENRFNSSQDILAQDIQNAVNDPAGNLNIRLALKKMGRPWSVNLSWATVPDLELPLLQGSDDEINERGTIRAREVYENEVAHQIELYAGYAKEDEDTVDAKKALDQEITQEHDPAKIDAYLDDQLRDMEEPQEKVPIVDKILYKAGDFIYRFWRGRDPGAKGMFEEVKSVSLDIREKIKNPDKSIPPLPLIYYIAFGVLVGIPVTYGIIRRLAVKLMAQIRKNDVVASIKHIAKVTTPPKVFKKLRLGKRGKDELKIIDIPAPEPKGVISINDIPEGISWDKVSRILTKDNQWGEKVSDTKVLLSLNLAEAQDDLRVAFGTDDYDNKIYPVLKKALRRKTDEEQSLQVNLRKWWSLLNEWNSAIKSNGEGNLPVEKAVKEFYEMKEFAKTVLSLMPYDTNQMQSTSAVDQSNLFYFNQLANYTLYLLEINLRNKSLTQPQRSQLEDDMKDLVSCVKYATHFSLILHYRTILNRVFNRMVHLDHVSEKPRWYLLGNSWYQVARRFLYFEWLKDVAIEGIEQNLDDLLQEARTLLPGLYKNPAKVKDENAEILQKVIDEGGTQDARAYHATLIDKIGNFWREFKYVVQFCFIILSTIGLLIGLRSFTSFGVDITFAGLYFLTWSWYWYCLPNWEAMNTKSWAVGPSGNIAVADRQKQKIIKNFSLKLAFDAAQLSNHQKRAVAPVQHNSLNVSSGSPLTKKPGGIDLNFQPTYIQRQSQAPSEDVPETVTASMPGEFKGFHFNIVRFTPSLTVNSAFDLMFPKA